MIEHYVINKLRLTCPGCGAVSQFETEALPGPYKVAPKLLAVVEALVMAADQGRIVAVSPQIDKAAYRQAGELD